MRVFTFGAAISAAALLCLGVPPSSSAPQADAHNDVPKIVRTIESRYHSSNTLKAVFLERYIEDRKADRIEAGTVYFEKPGRMRWDYESPEPKLFLTDGKIAWFYVPADHTVTRAPMKESEDWRTPLALLTGNADLNRYCKHITLEAAAESANPGDVTLRCEPAGQPHDAKNAAHDAEPSERQALSLDRNADIQDVLLEADPVTGWLARVIIRERGSVEMEYGFGRWQQNPTLPAELFRFVAPKNVAIVGENSSPSSPH